MLKLGLTGAFGSGKSTVARMMQDMGARLIDADRLAREAIEPGRPAHAEIVESFGPEVLAADGRIDRAALADAVFEDPERRRRLEAIIHPRVRDEERCLSTQAGPGEVVVFDVPLLFETGFDRECDRTCVVLVDEARRNERLDGRGFSPEEVRRRLEAQMDPAEKARRADYTIDNSGSLEATRRQAGRLMKELKRLAARPSDSRTEPRSGP